jgi:hypothetical protein
MLAGFQYKEENVYKLKARYYNAQGNGNVREYLKCSHFMPVSVFYCRRGRVIDQFE